jgi:hypothetical protein
MIWQNSVLEQRKTRLILKIIIDKYVCVCDQHPVRNISILPISFSGAYNITVFLTMREMHRAHNYVSCVNKNCKTMVFFFFFCYANKVNNLSK